MAEWIKFNNLPCFVIATKVDQISKSEVFITCKHIEKEFMLEVFPFSKENKYYNEKITEKLESLILSYSCILEK